MSLWRKRPRFHTGGPVDSCETCTTTMADLTEAVDHIRAPLETRLIAWGEVDVDSAYPVQWEAVPEPTPLGEVEQVPLRLDQCWRCFGEIPREDELGLCGGCVQALRDI